MTNTCDKCLKSFSDISNLRKHVKRFHPQCIETLGKYKTKTENDYVFTCQYCDKHFTYKKHFTFHLKSHNESLDVQNINIKDNLSKKCPLCEYRSSFQKNLISHFELQHDIKIIRTYTSFSGSDEFTEYLKTVESDTTSRFVKKMSTENITKFECNRSGDFLPMENRSRALKTKGSNKINAYCPASLTLRTTENGNYQCEFIENHVGHTNEIGYLFLSKEERKNLAIKVAAKIPFEVILDEVRDSFEENNLERLHLLTKRDLNNIEKEFNLNSTRHHSDAVSVDSLVTQMSQEQNNCVLFYKSQDTLSEEYTNLKKEDFVLIIMNQAQNHLLKKYGSDCICLDGTHGTNGYNFELITLLVIDDMRQGFPCAFMFTNRCDKETLKIFFSSVRKVSDIINPNVFMTDVAESFYNAWTETMGVPKLRLFCSWHVDRAWRKNLNKIKETEKQVLVYKKIRCLMEERDVTAFSAMKDELCNQLLQDTDTIDFAKYFIDNYMQNFKCWAYSYRLHSGLNTNMHLERMHRTLKYLYLKGKHNKRLDKAITSIMKFIRDRLFDRLITIHKGKITSKLTQIRERHKNSLMLDTNLVNQTENGWAVLSSNPNNFEVYLIKKIKSTCDCNLICTDCNNICLHMYSCSCPDSSIKWTMCKHIHLVCRKENVQVVGTDAEMETGENSLYIHIDNEPALTETESIVANLSQGGIKSQEEDISKEKDRIIQEFLDIANSVKTKEQLEVLRKTVTPLRPTLQALENTNKTKLTLLCKNPHNKNISPQRLYSTKKTKNYSKKNCIKKPSLNESMNITLSLLNNK